MTSTINEMLSHWSHPEHTLKLGWLEVPFKCAGCNELGIGSSYRCGACDFDLHSHCAIPSPTITHPFYPQSSFRFPSRPLGARHCKACMKSVMGFLYHCSLDDFYLHPCCAKLPMVIDGGSNKLILLAKFVSAPKCHRCGIKCRSWGYRSCCKKYSFHVACVKKRLVESRDDLYTGIFHGSRQIPSLKATLRI